MRVSSPSLSSHLLLETDPMDQDVEERGNLGCNSYGILSNKYELLETPFGISPSLETIQDYLVSLEAPLQGWMLTLQDNYSKVLSCLDLSGGKTLVGPWVALLGSRDEQRLIVDSPDGDKVIWNHQLCIAEPTDGVFRRARKCTREDDSASNASL